MVYECENGDKTHYSEVELGYCESCRNKLLKDERERLFQFAWMLNNYRRFESDEDVYSQVDYFLSGYEHSHSV